MTVTSESPEAANVVHYRDLREWIARVDALGELKRVNGARWQDEIGVICELNAKRPPHPALLFDDIPGYPSGFRILTAATNTARRLALTLRLPATNTAELVGLMRGGRVSGWQRQAPEFAPRVVPDGPVLECVQEGAEVDLETFPTPTWHEYDGGRYIGPGNAV
ncbi:MAG: UbiD family decarboxylase, partial [Chloroflexi bacterium]|nr:UbiD family decarboxylase [Chloroflexota bacterium]